MFAEHHAHESADIFEFFSVPAGVLMNVLKSTMNSTVQLLFSVLLLQRRIVPFSFVVLNDARDVLLAAHSLVQTHHHVFRRNQRQPLFSLFGTALLSNSGCRGTMWALFACSVLGRMGGESNEQQ